MGAWGGAGHGAATFVLVVVFAVGVGSGTVCGLLVQAGIGAACA